MGHSTEHKSGILDSVLGGILVLGAGAAAYYVMQDTESMFKIANDIFQLTKQEICLIPCGVLLFVAFWFEMDYLIFKPFLKLLEERESASKGVMLDSHAIDQEVIKIEKSITKRIYNSRQEFLKVKLQKIDEAKEEAVKIMQEAENKAAEKLNETRKKTVVAAEELKKELAVTDIELSNSIFKCFNIAE